MFSYEFLAGQIDDTYPQPNHSMTMFQNNQRGSRQSPRRLASLNAGG